MPSPRFNAIEGFDIGRGAPTTVVKRPDGRTTVSTPRSAALNTGSPSQMNLGYMGGLGQGGSSPFNLGTLIGSMQPPMVPSSPQAAAPPMEISSGVNFPGSQEAFRGLGGPQGLPYPFGGGAGRQLDPVTQLIQYLLSRQFGGM